MKAKPTMQLRARAQGFLLMDVNGEKVRVWETPVSGWKAVLTSSADKEMSWWSENGVVWLGLSQA